MKELREAVDGYNKRKDEANLGAKIFLLLHNIETVSSSEAVAFINNELPRETLQNPEYLDIIIKYAIIRGDANIFQALVDRGLDINFIDSDGNSVMDRAIASGHGEIINILINALEESIWNIDIENLPIVMPAEVVMDQESPYNLLANQVSEHLQQNITFGGVDLTPINQEGLLFSGDFLEMVMVELANELTDLNGMRITSLVGLSDETVHLLNQLLVMKLDGSYN
ncbi:MAG: ankyrin repeat domain-containing protein [Rickettsiales bacterium]|jgi:hypothetical protein|nr:ankyrin repeat domain-containing protein [Rickettsiales bacterium]